MLFGSKKDFDVLTNIGRELLKDIVEQEIGYYKLSLEDTQANIYGESTDKIYLDPVKLNCFITRGDQVVSVDDFGPDLGREASFAFIRQDLVDATTVPEVGDVVMYGSKFGSSVSIIVDCHLTRVDKIGITRAR